MVPLWKDPSQERPPLGKDHIFLKPKPSFTHKPPPLGRPPLYKDQSRWTSAAVFLEGDHCIYLGPAFYGISNVKKFTPSISSIYLTSPGRRSNSVDTNERPGLSHVSCQEKVIMAT